LQIPGSFVGHRYLQTFRRNHLCLSDMLMHADVCMFNKRLYLLYCTALYCTAIQQQQRCRCTLQYNKYSLLLSMHTSACPVNTGMDYRV